MIQKTTGFKLTIIKEIDEQRFLCEYCESNCLYSIGRKAIFYKCDLMPITIFDLGSDKEC